MPRQQEEFRAGVEEILQAVMFENWLRFYFINDENGEDNLSLKIPQKSLEKIEQLYPRLYPMAKDLNNKTITFESSRQAILNHIHAHVEGSDIPAGEAARILSSASFQCRLQLFHTWTQLHEPQLDAGFMEFGAWQNLFSQWLNTPGAKELADKIMGPKPH